MDRRQQAEQILESEVWRESFEAMRQELIDEWVRSPARDIEGREKLWVWLKQIDKLKANLEGYITDGKLRDFNERQSKVQQFFRKTS